MEWNESIYTLDLIFTNEDSMIDNVDVTSPLGKSHHNGLCFLFKCYHSEQVSKQTKLMYSMGDYNKLRGILNDVDWKNKLQDMSTEDAWKFIKENIASGIEKCVPSKQINTIGSKRKPLWMNSTALVKLKKKRAAYERYLLTKEGKDYAEYAKFRNQTKWEIRKAKRDFEMGIARQAKNNPKAFYNYSKSKLKTRAGVSDLKKSDGTVTQTNLEKAEVLNDYFTSVFTQEDVTNIPEAEKWDGDSFLDDLVITEDQVEKKLKGLKIDKSPGPDGMHPRILKELSDMIAGPLCILFNKSVLERALPQEWKDGHVTPIFKKGSKSDRANYQPVTLTSIVCKVMEHFVREAVLNHMRKHLVECQHGFIGGRSCTTNLLEVIDFWTKILDEGHALDVIYLDFSKAFDTVPHQRLLRKLSNYGIRGNVLGWIQDFLSDRRQRVMVNGLCSNWSPVLSGIPQGSVLGPVLFICYVNDMPGVIENGKS